MNCSPATLSSILLAMQKEAGEVMILDSVPQPDDRLAQVRGIRCPASTGPFGADGPAQFEIAALPAKIESLW